ncbi:TPA: hypothetical protein RQO16_005464 [Klebsiella oxytoca]|nr:hypothetical protein [Klebsiella oxytoca]
MTTDITELAPAMKAAAEPISSGYSRNWIVSHDDETCWVGANDDDGNLTPFIEVSIADWSGNKADNEKLARFIALCRPANVIALVEALEKERRICSRWRKTAEAHSEKLEKAQSKNALVAGGIEAAAKLHDRIAELEGALEVSQEDLSDTEDAMHLWAERAKKAESELESRTVTVNLPEPFKMAKSSSGLTYYYADEVNAALTAAGIKWEAE